MDLETSTVESIEFQNATFQPSICLAAFDHTSAHAEFPTQKMVVKILFP